MRQGLESKECVFVKQEQELSYTRVYGHCDDLLWD